MGLDQGRACLLLEESLAAEDNPDTEAGNIEAGNYVEDSDMVESRCSLEPDGLAGHCRTPYESEDPSAGLPYHHGDSRHVRDLVHHHYMVVEPEAVDLPMPEEEEHLVMEAET
jgi:hypothetical protein